MTNEHHDYIESDDSEYGESAHAETKQPSQNAPGWHRETFLSFWGGPDLEMIVLQNSGPSESWKWTGRGWRTPSEGDGADYQGWVEAVSRFKAEDAAIKWYMRKE